MSMEIQRLNSILSCLLVFFSTVCNGSIYDIEEEYYPVRLFWKCQGIPNLQSAKVKFIEDAARAYYLARAGGRAKVDRNLGLHVPPISIITNSRYLKMIEEVIEEPAGNLGSQFMMRINCELFNDLEWVKKDYNQELSRDTNGVRAVLDLIYRFGLCLRGIDQHLNCPDTCRAKGKKFCNKAVNSIGMCGTYVPSELSEYSIYKEPSDAKNLSEEFYVWYQQIPLENRFPQSLFMHFFDRREIFFNLYEAQISALKVPFCVCKPFFVYDRIQEVCVEELGDYACGGGNPCMNGGECRKASQSDDTADSNDDAEKRLFICECLPAFRGELCEHDYDPCASGNGVKVCQPFKCVRVPEDPFNGFRCRCPAGTHKPKNPTEPVCVPLEACKSGALKSGPCKAGGRCEQLSPNDPLDYKCHCPPGYTGKNCEDPPPEPFWATWNAWSPCRWPPAAEACFKRAYQECTRHCIVHAPGQTCQGPSRRIRYRVCDINSDDKAVLQSLTTEQRSDLEMAFALCDIGPSAAMKNQTLDESLLREPMNDIVTLDDWTNAGPEAGTYTLLPTVFHLLNKTALEAVNSPTLMDLVFLTGWIFACLLCVTLIFVWFYLIRVWILKYYGACTQEIT